MSTGTVPFWCRWPFLRDIATLFNVAPCRLNTCNDQTTVRRTPGMSISAAASRTQHPDPVSAVLANRPGMPGNSVFRINDDLSQEEIPQALDEARLEEYMSRLTAAPAPRRREFWLLAARLAEAVVLCAGNYADNGEFTAAGDLLANPRRVAIYQKRHLLPQIKPRHQGVSAALGWEALPGHVRIDRLRSETMVNIEKRAILPDLLILLADSDQMAAACLKRVRQRMARVAGTIGFLAAWGVKSNHDLNLRLARAPAPTRRFVFSQCCRFRGRRFRELGIAIEDLRGCC